MNLYKNSKKLGSYTVGLPTISFRNFLSGRNVKSISPIQLINFFPTIFRSVIQVPMCGYFDWLPTSKRWIGRIAIREINILCAIVSALSPKRVFEFGTHSGFSSLCIALNTPVETKIDTLDKSPRQNSSISEFTIFNKIIFHTAESKSFDFTPFLKKYELVFIDGGHDYNTVKKDSLNALKLLTKAGTILWHDYSPFFPGVVKAVNEITENHTIYKIRGTSFVFLKRNRLN